MAIHGDLKTMPVAELLRWVGAERRTGTLELERNSIRKSLVFREGRVVACASDDPATFLGQYLLSRGAITQEQLQEALREQESSGKNLGAIFVESGIITNNDRAEFVRAKAEETIYGVFDWDDATFQFEADAPWNPNIVELELEIDEIIQRGLERRQDVSDANEMLRDPAIILGRTRNPVSAEISGDPLAARILQLIDGERTIAELLLSTHAPEFVTRKLLVQLLRDGQVEIKEIATLSFDTDFVDGIFGTEETFPAPADQAAPEPDPDETDLHSEPVSATAVEPSLLEPEVAVSPPPVDDASEPEVAVSPPPVDDASEDEVSAGARVKTEIEVALGMMRKGENERALVLLRAISDAHPGDSSIRELIEEAERSLHDDLTSVDFSPTNIPVLVKPLREALKSNLSPHEAFILGLIDGVADVKGITWVAPMREVEALKILKQLQEKSLVIIMNSRAPASGSSMTLL